MRIAAVRTRAVALPLSRPYTIAYATIDSVEQAIVELEAEDGTVGLGCASPAPVVTGETFAACRAALAEDALAWLVGRDVRLLEASAREVAARLPAGAPAARAAVDMALHDLYGRRLGLPLVEVYGRCHERLPTSVTIGILGLEETLAEAREHVDAGFRALKVKLGADVDADLERLRRLRAEVGPDVALRVDANQAHDEASLRRFAGETADLDLELIEQPLPAGDVAAMRALPEALRARCMADESLCAPAQALELLRPTPAFGMFNIKLMKCGGPTAGRRIAELAELAGVALMWGCMDESRIGIAAALHLALAAPATRWIDLDGSFDLARDVAEGGFTVEDGCLVPLERPGLGATLLAET